MQALEEGTYFDRSRVISLARSEERYGHFMDGYGKASREEGSPDLFGEIERDYGYDAEILGAPSYLEKKPGVWGCRMSHLRLLEEAHRDGIKRLMVFEDDADWSTGGEGILVRIRCFLEQVPDDWDVVYLGYNPYGADVSWSHGNLDQPWSVCDRHEALNTHAICYRGASIPKIYRAILSLPDGKNCVNLNIDQALQRIQHRGDIKRYIPRNSLIYQQKSFPSLISE